MANAQAGDNQTGRYKLVTADVDHSGKQTVFKIDTVTGQAWMRIKDPRWKEPPKTVDPESPPDTIFEWIWAPIGTD